MELYNTFSAQIEAVVILKKLPILVCSPYKGHLTKPPHHRPQLPTRSEHVNAAEAFVPKSDLGLTTVSQFTTPLVSNPATLSEATTSGTVSTVGPAPIANIEDVHIPCVPSAPTVATSIHPTNYSYRVLPSQYH